MIILAALLAALHSAGATQVDPVLEKLPNGLQIVWFESAKLPLFDLVYVSRTGSKEDPQGKSGTLEMLSAVISRGAAGKSAQQIARSLEQLGSGLDFRVGEDFTTVGVHGLTQDLEAIAATWADVILQPDFPEAEITREKSRMIDRWMHLPDQTDSLAAVAFIRLLMRGTLYGRGNLLTRSEIDAIDSSTLRQAHARFKEPSRGLVLAVGSFNRTQLKSWLQERFGKPQDAAPSQVQQNTYADTRLPEPKAGDVIIIHRPKTNQSQVRIGFEAPAPSHPDHAAFQVLSAALGEHFGSRLNRVIRDEMGLTYSISSNILSMQERSFLAVSAATHNPQVGQLLKETRRMLEWTAGHGINEDELEISKSYLAGSFPLSIATLSAYASRWVGSYLFGLGVDYLDGVVARIQAVQLSDVNRVAKTWLKPNTWWVVSGDAAALESPLREAGFKSIKRVKPADLL
jgi:zinc protease